MNKKILVSLTLAFVTLMSVAAHAWENQGGGYNGKDFDFEKGRADYQERLKERAKDKKVRAHFAQLDYLCLNSVTGLNFTAAGYDRNGDGLSLSEVISDSARCDAEERNQAAAPKAEVTRERRVYVADSDGSHYMAYQAQGASGRRW